jgi:hypothetical protein
MSRHKQVALLMKDWQRSTGKRSQLRDAGLASEGQLFDSVTHVESSPDIHMKQSNTGTRFLGSVPPSFAPKQAKVIPLKSSNEMYSLKK